ncbi:MAG: hypothetical protein KDB53_21625 [Planctomycetes bacterium]|nr:hypothetical protein [Planctomycetota bacterium]
MNLRRRLLDLERRAGLREMKTVQVIWKGDESDALCYRETVQRAVERGWRVELIRICTDLYADSVEEAALVCERFRERYGQDAAVIVEHPRTGECMGEFFPALPDWLSGALEANR